MIYNIPTLIDSIESIMEADKPNHKIDLKLDDGNVIKIPIRLAIFNMLLNKPLIYFKIPVTKDDIHYIKAIKGDTISKIQSIQYKKLLEILTDVPHIDIVEQFFNTINDIYIWSREHLCAYQQTMSLVSLSKIQCHPKIKALTNKKLNKGMGTRLAEIEFNNNSKELIRLISTRGELEDNVLINFTETGSLKVNQIPQQMLAYGNRSDVDDSMFGNTIEGSAMDGLQSAHEYALEATSAKKSSFFNKHVIKDTEYFARELRLATSPIRKMYKGHCGSDITIPITIPRDHSAQFIDKVFFFQGEKIAVTAENHKQYADKRVSLISPLGCRYLDGVCEYCAGRNTTRPWDYLPSVSSLGIFCGTKVGKSVSQMILSAKHLIKTLSLMYSLHESSKGFLYVEMKNIILRKEIKNIDKCSIKIPIEFMGHLQDLTHGKIEAESFSSIKYIIMVDQNDKEVTLTLDANRITPFFSSQMLKHIKKNIPNIDSNDVFSIIPLKGFNTNYPLLNYNVINDDMIAFTREFNSMLRTRIRSYTSLTNILHDLMSILYSKTKVNIFFIEVLLKAFIRSPNIDECKPAVVIDTDDVRLGGMGDSIEESSVSSKLAHQRIGSTKYLCDAGTSTKPKGPGIFDMNFNF